MKTFFNKKIIPSLIVFSIFFSIAISFSPQKANAFVDIVNDPLNTVQGTITAGATNYSAFVKPSLDKIGIIIAKQLIRQITYSVVNWINSGFQGSPAFLQNPSAFFLDVGDQITGEFISKFGGPLSQLCSPFSINIRAALALKFGNGQIRYSCTLSKILGNTANAINGFTAGNFSKGGWPAFVSLTTQPQNNIYGSYLQADSDLSFSIASAQARNQSQVSAGNGFLSWQDPACIKATNAYNASVRAGNQVYSAEGSSEGQAQVSLKKVSDCPVQTPGSTIANSLQNNLNGPLRELELVQDINQIVNALFSQLVVQVLQKGLTNVSAPSSSGGSSFLKQTVDDFNKDANAGTQTAKDNIIKNINSYKNGALEYQKNRDNALALVNDIKNTYLLAKVCFTSRLATETRNHGNIHFQTYPAEIANIDNAIATKIDPKIPNLFTLSQQASVKVKAMQDVENKINTSTTAADLNTTNQKYTDMLGSQNIVSPIDIQASKDDLTNLQTEMALVKADAQRELILCQSN